MGRTCLHQYCGEMLTLDEVSTRSGLPKTTLIYRMCEYKVSAEEASQMVFEKEKRFEWVDGRMLTLREIELITGIKAVTIKERLRRGIPFVDACTQKSCSARKYGIDVTPKLSDEELYLLDGEVNQRAAKAICREMLGIDPRKLNLREVNYWLYLFDTDSIAFEIDIRNKLAVCIGRLKKNGNTLIERKYKIGDKVKEVTYG